MKEQLGRKIFHPVRVGPKSIMTGRYRSRDPERTISTPTVHFDLFLQNGMPRSIYQFDINDPGTVHGSVEPAVDIIKPEPDGLSRHIKVLIDVCKKLFVRDLGLITIECRLKSLRRRRILARHPESAKKK